MELASYFPVAGHQLLRADRPVQEVKHRPVRQRHIALRIYGHAAPVRPGLVTSSPCPVGNSPLICEFLCVDAWLTSAAGGPGFGGPEQQGVEEASEFVRDSSRRASGAQVVD